MQHYEYLQYHSKWMFLNINARDYGMFNVNLPRDYGCGARLSALSGNTGWVHDDSKKITSSTFNSEYKWTSDVYLHILSPWHGNYWIAVSNIIKTMWHCEMNVIYTRISNSCKPLHGTLICFKANFSVTRGITIKFKNDAYAFLNSTNCSYNN